ncbi:MAG: hypothetical protein AB2693_11555 [Candidatus Thiodiazotropha sp.]
MSKLLKHSDGMFKDKVSSILYCYGSAWQPVFDEMLEKVPNIRFKEGLPSEEEIRKLTSERNHTCLILDDLASQINSNPSAEQLWTIHSHHLNMTIIYLAHNLFQKSPSARVISLNTKYYILFKNHRDALQIQHFARQVYPLKSKFFMSAYHLATEPRWGYLVVDLHNLSNDEYRLRTNIFPNEDTIIYQPKA